MEILNVSNARAVWLLDPFDLNPQGRKLDFIGYLKESYKFGKAPAHRWDLTPQNALLFLDGEFRVEPDLTISIDLEMYNDGFVAISRASTEYSEMFLRDMLESAAGKLKLQYRPDVVRRKIYANEMEVRPTKDLRGLNPRLQLIAEKISTALGVQKTSPFEVTSIALWQDPHPPSGYAAFRFERKLGVPFSENRYYTVAPLHTKDHLALLDEFEQILLSE